MPDDGRGAPFDKITKAVTFIIAGFLAAINLIGLSNGEISDVLRNYSHQVAFVALLISLAVGTAIWSNFVFRPDRAKAAPAGPAPATPPGTAGLPAPEKAVAPPPADSASHKFPWSAALAVVALVIALWLATIGFIPIASSGGGGVGWLVFAGIFGLIAIGLAVLAWGRRDHEGSASKLGPLLLAFAVVMTVLATYAAIRLETASQLTKYRPQLSTTLATTDTTITVTASIDVSRLRDKANVELAVFGHPTPAAPAAAASNGSPSSPAPTATRSGGFGCDDNEVDSPGCPKASCPQACILLSDGTYAPDVDGALKQSVTVSVDPGTYDYIDAVARVCSPATQIEKPSTTKASVSPNATPSGSSTATPSVSPSATLPDSYSCLPAAFDTALRDSSATYVHIVLPALNATSTAATGSSGTAGPSGSSDPSSSTAPGSPPGSPGPPALPGTPGSTLPSPTVQPWSTTLPPNGRG